MLSTELVSPPDPTHGHTLTHPWPPLVFVPHYLVEMYRDFLNLEPKLNRKHNLLRSMNEDIRREGLHRQ